MVSSKESQLLMEVSLKVEEPKVAKNYVLNHQFCGGFLFIYLIYIYERTDTYEKVRNNQEKPRIH